MDVTVREAKTQLSKLLRRVEAGVSVTIRRGREPIAMLVKVPAPAGQRRVWGDLDGSLGSEFDTLPDDFAPSA